MADKGAAFIRAQAVQELAGLGDRLVLVLLDSMAISYACRASSPQASACAGFRVVLLVQSGSKSPTTMSAVFGGGRHRAKPRSHRLVEQALSQLS